MKKIRNLMGATLVSFALLAPTGLNAQTVSVEDLLDHVRSAVNAVNRERERRLTDLPPLTRVSLTLNTIREMSEGGQIRIWIFTIGHGRSGELVRTINLELEPPPANGSATLMPEINLAEELTDAIVDAALAAQTVRIEDPQGDPMVVLSRLSATVRFSVRSEGSADFQIVAIEAGTDVAFESVQQITIEFGG